MHAAKQFHTKHRKQKVELFNFAATEICTTIRGIFMLNPPSPPYVKEEQEENQGNRRFFIKEKFRSDFLAATEFFTKSRLRAANLTKKLNSEEADPVIFLWRLGILM